MLRESIRFDEESLRIDHHAVAEHARLAAMHDARRQQVQHERLIADLDRVAGVVPALVARDDIETLCEQIDDLAFTFVAPLGADDCNYFFHNSAISWYNSMYLRAATAQELSTNIPLC